MRLAASLVAVLVLYFLARVTLVGYALQQPSYRAPLKDEYLAFAPVAYFLFCLLGCLPFLRGRLLVAGGTFFHLLILPYVVDAVVRESRAGETWISTLLLISAYPVLWWLMCWSRLRGEKSNRVRASD
jgi:hypothetical protein